MATPVDNPQLRYLKTQIETASQPQLLVMLFDAAVNKLHISKKAILDKNIEKAHNELTKVQKIFTELMVALDLEKGGELATNLLSIYDFVYHRLVRANIKQDAELIDEVLPIVENLRDGWTQAVNKYMQENDKPASGAQPDRSVFTASKKAVDQIEKTKAKNGAGNGEPAKAPAKPPANNAAERPRLNIQG